MNQHFEKPIWACQPQNQEPGLELEEQLAEIRKKARKFFHPKLSGKSTAKPAFGLPDRSRSCATNVSGSRPPVPSKFIEAVAAKMAKLSRPPPVVKSDSPTTVSAKLSAAPKISEVDQVPKNSAPAPATDSFSIDEEDIQAVAEANRLARLKALKISKRSSGKKKRRRGNRAGKKVQEARAKVEVFQQQKLVK